MTMHKSLKSRNTLVGLRSVLSRWERIEKLTEAGRWKEGDAIIGLPKVRTKFKIRSKAKAAPAAGEVAAEGAAAAAPAAAAGAKGAAAPAAGKGAPAAKGAAPAAGKGAAPAAKGAAPAAPAGKAAPAAAKPAKK